MNTAAVNPDQLPRLSVPRLRALWSDLGLPGEPPGLKRLLVREIAWRVQARETGGMDAETRRLLTRAKRSATREPQDRPRKRRRKTRLAPGATLVRTWRGSEHTVTVTEAGFRYDGRDYASLSEVAREITGTRWSGPRFFGINQLRSD